MRQLVFVRGGGVLGGGVVKGVGCVRVSDLMRKGRYHKHFDQAVGSM